jgi:hypothetical protein
MKWIYDYMDYMMLNVDAIISLASMMYILSWGYYELHPMNEKIFDNFLIEECELSVDIM